MHVAGRNMDVHHGIDGGRRVAVERADHSRIFAERGRPGYIDRRYSYGGYEFARRAYFYNGREYNRFYQGCRYRNLDMEVYAPGRFYGAGFYGWAYNPWTTPVYYSWGFGGAPWYGYYGSYFAPYSAYPTASYG